MLISIIPYIKHEKYIYKIIMKGNTASTKMRKKNTQGLKGKG